MTGPRVGAWFTGRNELPERTWETRSQVVAADRGREFAFEVNSGWVRWGYTFTAVDTGTQVTESWEFLPAGISGFHDRYGDDAAAQIANRTELAHRGIPVTLAAIKKAAEGGLTSGYDHPVHLRRISRPCCGAARWPWRLGAWRWA